VSGVDSTSTMDSDSTVSVDTDMEEECEGASGSIDVEQVSNVTGVHVLQKKVHACKVCERTFSSPGNVSRHTKKEHPHYNNIRGNCVCLECGKRYYRIAMLREHLVTDHEFTFKYEENLHANEREFLDWKAHLEMDLKCSFVKPQGKHVNHLQQEVQHFHCNRSGKYRPRLLTTGKRERQMKANGTVKIDTMCTSSIKATRQADDSYKSEICTTHYGHEIEVVKTWLPITARRAARRQVEIMKNELMKFNCHLCDKVFTRHDTAKRHMCNVHGLETPPDVIKGKFPGE